MTFLGSSTLDALRQEWNDRFLTKLQEAKSTWDVSAIAEEIRMNGDIVNLPILDVAPGMQVWTGDRVHRNLAMYNVQMQSIHYANSVSISADQLEDSDNMASAYGIQSFTRSIDKMAQRASYDKNKIVATALYTSTTGFDGVSIFSDSHPVDPSDASVTNEINGSSTWDNLFASTALSYDNFTAVKNAMALIPGPDGKPLGIDIDTLVVPQALSGLAMTIANADYVGLQTFNGATQVGTNVNQHKGIKLIIMPELAANSSTTWYAFDSRFKPIALGIRKDVQFVTLFDEATRYKENKYYAGCDARWVAKLVLPHGVAKCTA